MNNRRMMTLLAAWVMMLCSAGAQGPNNSGTYYSGANGKSGNALRKAMGGVINPHTNIGYNGLWSAYEKTDKRADGYVRDWYSNTTSYTFSQHTGGYKQEGDMYNREHTVPQSWFNEAAPMKADVVHVVPADGFVNNMRADYPFGEVSTISKQSNNGYSKLGPCKNQGYSSTVFEPNDEIKGDIARIYFYMATCYASQCANWSGGVFTAGDGLVTWTLNMMMDWAKQDPVDDVETARNNAVYAVQKNRNPFVDYPGLEDYIWGDKQNLAFSYDNYGGDVATYVAKPVITPAAGTYYSQVEVTITCATEDAQIYYTTDGADASEQSIPYDGPFTLTETATVKAVAVKDDGVSAQATADYVITDVDPVEGLIALNNAFFGTSYTGAMNSNVKEDLTGTVNGITVTYSLGSGSNRYCNDSQIRLYQGNKLTVSTEQGLITGAELVLATASTKQLTASTGMVDGLSWTGNASSVDFSVNSGSGNMQVTGIKLTTTTTSAIDLAQRDELTGQRVVYNLRGQRVAHPTRGLYIIDGKKVFIR